MDTLLLVSQAREKLVVPENFDLACNFIVLEVSPLETEFITPRLELNHLAEDLSRDISQFHDLSFPFVVIKSS